MRLIRITVLLMVLAGLSLTGLNAQPAGPSSSNVPAMSEATPARPAQTAPEAKSEGLPARAPTIFHIGSFPVTNSMLVTWIVALGVIIFAQYATRNLKDIPNRAQTFWELLV